MPGTPLTSDGIPETSCGFDFDFDFDTDVDCLSMVDHIVKLLRRLPAPERVKTVILSVGLNNGLITATKTPLSERPY